MDKLPSRHAISEVMSWISLMENVIQKDEEEIKNCIGYKAIHEYLQKYKVISRTFDVFPIFFRLLYLSRTQKLKLGNQASVFHK